MNLGSPDDWHVKGEGAANVVFEYRGDLKHLSGCVLRVRKARSPRPESEEALEREVWAPVLGAAAVAGGPAARQQAYTPAVLAPLLGRQHLPPQHTLSLDTCFCVGLRAGSALDPACAALMPDATLLPGGLSAGPPPPPPGAAAAAELCVELKPKCGYVGGACPTVHPANRALKRSASRFRLHQALKLEQGRAAARSGYDPPDLFAEGEPGRVLHALEQLMRHPQNNLALFAGGRPMPPPAPAAAMQGGASCCGGGSGELGWVAEAAGGLLAPLPAAERPPALARLLAAVLQQEGILPRLLEAQRRCKYDVEGVYQLYCQLASRQAEPAAAAVDAAAAAAVAAAAAAGLEAAAAVAAEQAEHAAAVASLLALPHQQALRVLRDYSVAATAKDCAIMVALRRVNPGTEGSGGGGGGAPEPRQQRLAEPEAGGAACAAPEPGLAVDPGSGLACAYRLLLVDLDLKPLAKIPVHHALDQAVLAAAARAAAPGAEPPQQQQQQQQQRQQPHMPASHSLCGTKCA